MQDGFLKVGADTLNVHPADVEFNLKNAMEAVKNACRQGVKLVVLPELCVTGCALGNLYLSDSLQEKAKEALLRFKLLTKDMDIVSVLGLPFAKDGKLYNCAAVVCKGHILGIVPKRFTTANEYGIFADAPEENSTVDIDGETVDFGTKLLFNCDIMKYFCFAVMVGDDVLAPSASLIQNALNGAYIIAAPSSSKAFVESFEYRRNLIKMLSSYMLGAVLYANAGQGETTTDCVYSGHNIIAQNGNIKAENSGYEGGVTAVLDLQIINYERKTNAAFVPLLKEYKKINFSLEKSETDLPKINPSPFILSDEAEQVKRCEEILKIQTEGLKKRLLHTKCKSAVIGISGGLDSALALLVTAKAFDAIGIDKKNILAVTMPCFGTSERTYNNALEMCNEIGVTLKEINIKNAVGVHFEDIGHDTDEYDITYENAQARERMQVLFDMANSRGAIVIGTGDLSELALGWATYGGDHLSSYGVNASIPKTVVRELVGYEAKKAGATLGKVLFDVVNTPVSPELLPTKNGEIAQKTENSVGPYKLHDFFIYYFIRYGFTPDKIQRMAQNAFENEYDEKTINKWLCVFIKRFFAQQFKRSCLPDGASVGTVSLSPRGAFKMPSDAVSELWFKGEIK